MGSGAESERKVVLGGDIGATKTNLALYAFSGGIAEILFSKNFFNSDYRSIKELLGDFLKEISISRPEIRIDAATFGAPGIVKSNRCLALNIDWVIDGTLVSEQMGVESVTVVNDIVALGHGLLSLQEGELFSLQEGEPNETGERSSAVVLAAGTGLGESILFFDGSGYIPTPGEGGHADFAPRTPVEIDLLTFLMERYGHVSYERLLSGEGIENIFEFICTRKGLKNEEIDISASQITEAAEKGGDPLASEALALFVSIYGAEAGNAALRAMATKGVYIGGGIAPKIIETLKEGGFMEAFIDKGRYSEVMKRFPVRIILSEEAPLRGAAILALKSIGISNAVTFSG